MTDRRTRRQLVAGGLSLGLGLAAGARLAWAASGCAAPAGATPRQTEGPFFSPGTPLRRDLRSDAGPGRPFDLEAVLRDRGCRPLEGAVVELWHADPEGRYDNDGFRFRGHQVTDAEGRFRFQTLVPGLYPGRTRHFHLILAARGARPLTTQLYFPDEPRNARDFLYDPALLMRVEGEGEGPLVGRYDFVAR